MSVTEVVVTAKCLRKHTAETSLGDGKLPFFCMLRQLVRVAECSTRRFISTVHVIYEEQPRLTSLYEVKRALVLLASRLNTEKRNGPCCRTFPEKSVDTV